MKRLWLVGAIGASAFRVWADAPLPPPSEITRCSPGKKFCAVAEPKRNAVVVYRAEDRRTELWAIDQWQRSFDVSDDGHLVVCYSGLNLLPVDYKPDWIMLKFYERGRLVREWTLRELVPDLSKLQRTASHYRWGQCRGFGSGGLYEVETVDRGNLRFDVRTGSLAR